MYSLAAKALTLAHETFRCGVPHFRERRILPIRTSAHLIVFDIDKISPLYTMLQVKPTDETNVGREDNFVSGDISLPEELCTTEKHYSNWNRANPNFPVDKGHSAGSQYRRGDQVLQSDIDTLAGVTPEASKTNRNVKGPLESAILARAKKQTHTYLVQGPIWYGTEPIHGKLENGQWIPDALFISSVYIHKKKVTTWTWQMENAKTVYGKNGANLREISLDRLEALTGLYVWGNIGASDFQNRRHKLSGGTWWKAGQPKRRR
ncbi:MAG: DNA/RNA non-specific endonuclease [bacterium]